VKTEAGVVAVTPALIGLQAASGSPVTSLAVTTPSLITLSSRIVVAICTDTMDWDDFVDTAGSTYDIVSASISPDGSLGVWLLLCESSGLLSIGNSFTLTRAAGFNGAIGIYTIAGLTSGAVDAGSAGAGSNASPLVSLDNIAVNDLLIGVVGVKASSAIGFTQDSNFTSPGNFNSQTTTSFSVFSGYMRNTQSGLVSWKPTLGSAAQWVALMVALQP
jgi:hypothetical protein